MHQQLWGYKVEWKSVSRGTGGKKVEYHWSISTVISFETLNVYLQYMLKSSEVFRIAKDTFGNVLTLILKALLPSFKTRSSGF
jgi:hypothetical protein